MEGIWIVVVGIAGPLIGAVATLLVTRWQQEAKEHDTDESNVITYYTNELAHCRTESAMWRSLALENMGGLQKAVSVIEEQQRNETGGQE